MKVRVLGAALVGFQLFRLVKGDEAADTNDDDCSDDDGAPIWVEDGGWAFYLMVLCGMFWGLAVTVEDFFIPALNIMCEKFNIPDDVAGATFMAAGASSPEMFSNFIALFITHSSLGVGTIIGSEIFNHLMICAGSVAYAKAGYIQLDPRLVLREACFYLAALGLLILALLKDSTNDSYCKSIVVTGIGYDDEATCYADKFCIFWYDGLFLLLGYFVYVFVCAYYQKLMATCCPVPNLEEEVASDNLRPSFAGVQGLDGGSVHTGEDYQQLSDSLNDSMHFRPTEEPGSLLFAAVAPSHLGRRVMTDMYYTEGGPEQDVFGCYLFKRSRFYSKMRMASNAWQMRWCTVDREGFRSFRDRQDSLAVTGGSQSPKGVRAFNIYEAGIVDPYDRVRFIFRLGTPDGSLYFQAPNEETYNTIIQILKQRVAEYKNMPSPTRKAMRRVSLKTPLNVSQSLGDLDTLSETSSIADDEDGLTGVSYPGMSQDFVPKDADPNDGDEDYHSLIAWPHGFFPRLLHVFYFPLKALMYYTIPDARLGGKGDSKYPLAILMCFVWLIGLSYVMVVCLDSFDVLS